MSVAAILSAFRQAVTAGRIDGSIMPLLGKLVQTLGVDLLPLTNGEARPVGSTAVLTGETVWRNTTWSVTVVGDTAHGVEHLALTLQATVTLTPWTLGQSFPEMPPSRVLSSTAGGVLNLVPSVLVPMIVEQPQAFAEATEGLNPQPSARLQGWLRLDGILAPYVEPLGATRAWLDGPMTFPAAGEADLHLIAATPGADGTIPGIDTGRLELALTTTYPDPYTFETIPPATSMVELLISVDLGGRSSNVVVVRSPLLQTGQIWPLEATINPKITLADGIASLVSMIDGSKPSDFQLPSGLAPLDAFGLSELKLGVTPWNAPSPLDLVYTGLTIESKTPWEVPVPFVTIENVGTTWMLNWTRPTAITTGSIWGTMAFGADTGTSLGAAPSGQRRTPPIPQDGIMDENGDPVRLYVQVDLPSLDIYAETRGPITLALPTAMNAYFPGTQPDVPVGIIVERISATASMYTQAYGASLIASGSWPITIGDVAFSLENLIFEVQVTQATVSGSLEGFVGVSVAGEQQALFNASAIYPGDGTWTFNAGLADGELKLIKFAYAFLGVTPPTWLDEFDIVLTKLWMSYSTAEGNPYGAGAALALRWEPAALGLTLSLEAETEIRYYAVRSVAERMDRAALARARTGLGPQEDVAYGPLLLPAAAEGDPPAMTYAGSVKGRFELNRLMLTIGMSYVGSEQTYLFGLEFERFLLTARTSWTGKGTGRHQILTVDMAGATLGEMVESFARLANPNTNYRLEAPWTFLNKIDLGRFKLILDPSEQSVTLDYRMNLELGFITITSVGLRYQRGNGEPQVLFEITGQFLGKTYDRSDATGTGPLSWDAVNDAAPAVPGKGPSLIDLRYLGFGQHVDLTGLTRPDSMAEIISLMKQQMRPVSDTRVNPLTQPSGEQMVFNEASQWLIGLDVTLMGTVSVSLVMHDPDLYGVLIALAGPDAGSLAGFSFELIYKKVTDDVGVFHVRLQVPDAFRQLDFGLVQISLGIITVDIFTNGNFLIDLGFPHNRDFSLSFGVTYGVFMGRGGIYFGLLDGATSKRVPAITNGTFDPVLELGVGLAVGVGRTFNKGPLKAGLYVEVEVVFQGVLAWFHPDDAARPSAMYYWARGTAALVGRLYGSVDFKVISVDVNVEAFAAVTLTLAAHQPTLIELKVGVRVSASIKIFFVRISFSFGMTIEASFTIGSASTTPWVLSADQSGRALDDQRFTAFASRRRRPHDVRLQSRLARLTARNGGGLRALGTARAGLTGVDPSAAYDLVWDPTRKLFPDQQVHDVVLKMLPAFTVANPPVAWSGETPPPNPDPDWRISFILMADSAVPAEARDIADTHRLTAEASAQAETVAGTAFNTLIEAMLRWAVSALPDVSDPVTMGDLDDLATQLDSPQTLDQGFSLDALSTLFMNNLLFKLGGRPTGGRPIDQGGVAFPIPPVLSWTSPDLPVEVQRNRNFATYQPIDAVYQAEVAAYFADLDARAADHRPTLAAIGVDEAGASMAAFVFRDYMALIAKTAVQAAETLLTAWPVPLAGTETLANIAASFPTVSIPYVKQVDDTVEQVAGSLGLSTSEILALNPGIVMTLDAATPGQVITVKQGVTPESLAAANPDRLLAGGKTISVAVLPTQVREAETLSAIASRLHGDLAAWLQTASLLDKPGLLRAGAPLTLAGLSYANPLALDIRSVAAVFFARLPVGAEYPHADWYAEAIVQLNGNKIGADGLLPAQVTAPAAYDDIRNTVTWTTLPGDTLVGLSRTLTWIQNLAPDSVFETYLARVQALNPTAGATPVRLPDAVCPILPDETLRDLAKRLLLVDPGTLPMAPIAAFDGFVVGADILQPLAEVFMTSAALPTVASQTLASFAARYDLTVLDVGRLGAEVAGLIAPDPNKPLIVPSVPAIDLDTLVAKILTGESAATVAGQVSRFMLNGQRIPAPVESGGHYTATGPLTGLYALIGQQVNGPAPDTTLPPETVRAQVTVTSDEVTPWLVFVDSAAVPPGETLKALSASHPDLARLNPALSNERLKPGMVVLTGEIERLVFNITEAELAAGYPATSLLPQFDGGLSALTLYRDDPVRHALSETRRWQTPTPPAFAAFAAPSNAGMPSLWPFTGDLKAKASQNSEIVWNLKAIDPERGPEAAPRPVQNYVWASQIDLRIQRVPGRPNTYELFGADTAGRQRLLEAWRYLADHPTETADLTLLYQLSLASGLPPGLTSAAMDLARTFLVKTNLSTETRSGVSVPLDTDAVDPPPPTFGDFYAAIGDTRRFLTLLWEASVVGGGGYWLEITAPDGSGLPDQIFGGEGGGVVSLMIVLGSQSSATPSRKLVSFNTCALVADPVDASATAFFVEAADRAELARQSTVRPGEVGFQMQLTATVEGDEPATPQDRLRDLYSLLGYQLLDTPAFEASGQGKPIGPLVQPGSDETVWQLSQIIPTRNFAKAHPLPAVGGLPDPAADPYAGVSPGGSDPVMARTTVEVWFRDVFGNSSASGDSAQ